MSVVLLVNAINLLGTDVMVKFNTLLAIVSLTPTLIFVTLGLPKLEPTRMLQPQASLTLPYSHTSHSSMEYITGLCSFQFDNQGEIDWSLLVSWTLWLYCGFFSLGTLAGELERPRRTFLLTIAILFPAVLLLNTLPLAVALSLDDDASHYAPGHFNVLAKHLAGGWLDWGFQLGANVCLMGLCNASSLTAQRSLCFLVNCRFAKELEALAAGETGAIGQNGANGPRDLEALAGGGKLGNGGKSAKGGNGKGGNGNGGNGKGGNGEPLRRWLFSTQNTGVAPLFILLNACCAAFLVWLPYDLLVEFSMLLSVPSILLFMWSFVALRVQRPDVPRPFLIPGGLCLAICITVLPVAICIAYAAVVGTEFFATHRRRADSNSIQQIYSMMGVMGVGFAVHAFNSLRFKLARRSRHPVLYSLPEPRRRGSDGQRGGRRRFKDAAGEGTEMELLTGGVVYGDGGGVYRLVGHSRSHELEIRSRALPISACRGDARSAAATIGSDLTNPKAESSIFVLVVLLHLCLWDYQYDFDYVIRSYGLAKKSFFFGHLFFNTSWPPQEKLFIWSLFFNITNVFCAKKWVGHACICPMMVTG